MRKFLAIGFLYLLACVLGVSAIRAETAILGETGSAGSYFNTTNRIRALLRTATQDGTLDSIYVYVANVQTGAVAKGVLYDSTTLVLVDSTAEKTLSADGGSFHWEGFAFEYGAQIDSGKTYLLGIFVGSTNVGVTRVPAADSRYYADYTYASGVPQTLSGGTWANDQLHQIYVVYTVATTTTPGVTHRRRAVIE